MASKKQAAPRKKRIKRSYTKGIAHIHASNNNTIVTISDEQGNVIAWASAGGFGYKGAKKATAYAAQEVATACAKKAKDQGITTLDVRVKGTGLGRETAIRGLSAADLKIQSIVEATPLAHNGCRPPKKPRG